ncbi:8233_t:CDS:2, partial [Funneliformis mosseae]
VEGTLTRIQRFVQQYRHRIRDGNTLDDFIQRAWLPDKVKLENPCSPDSMMQLLDYFTIAPDAQRHRDRGSPCPA